MGRKADADARALQAAIDEGEPADVQYEKLLEEAQNCYEAADKIQDLNQKVDAFAACQGIFAKAQFILAHADAIDGALGIPSSAQINAWVQQANFNKRYDQVYNQYKDKTPPEIQAAYNQVVGQGLSLSRAAALAALIALMNHQPWHPPVYDPDAPPQVPTPTPAPTPTETPDTGWTPEPGETPEPVNTSDGDSDQMSAAMRRRPQGLASRYPRKLVDGLMPLSDYWLVNASGEATLHFVDECPACQASRAEPRELEEAEHPLSLAERLDAHPCGTCMRMAEASLKEGFLFGCFTESKMLGVWQDRVEFESSEWFGLNRRKVTVETDDIKDITFTSPTDVSLATAQGPIQFPFPRPIDRDIAEEAFRRLGWTFNDG